MHLHNDFMGNQHFSSAAALHKFWVQAFAFRKGIDLHDFNMRSDIDFKILV